MRPERRRSSVVKTEKEQNYKEDSSSREDISSLSNDPDDYEPDIKKTFNLKTNSGFKRKTKSGEDSDTSSTDDEDGRSPDITLSPSSLDSQEAGILCKGCLLKRVFNKHL